MHFDRLIIISGILLIFAINLHPVAWGQVAKQPPNENILKGIDLLSNNQFEQALNLFQGEIDADPRDPSGYFYLAMVSWSRLAYGYWEAKDVKEFIQRVDRTVAVAREKITDQTADSWTYFYLGGALGFKARLRLSEEKYFTSFQQAKEAVQALKTASKMDPENKSVLLGMGIFDYYSAKLSGFLKFLTNLLLHRGNAAEGLRKLHLAAEESIYSQTEARSVLLHIYLFMENDPAKALPLAGDLADRYPLNQRYKYLQGLAYALLRQDEEYNALLEELSLNGQEPPGNTTKGIWENQALYLEASRLMLRGYHELARKKLDQILQNQDPQADPAMVAWPIFKKGMSFDLAENREAALTHYNRVLAMANGAGAKFFAKKYKGTAAKKGDPFIGY